MSSGSNVYFQGPKMRQVSPPSYAQIQEAKAKRLLNASGPVSEKPAIVLDLYPSSTGFDVHFGVKMCKRGRQFLSRECPKYVRHFVVNEMRLRPSVLTYSPFKERVDTEKMLADIKKSRMLVISGSPLDVSRKTQPSTFADMQARNMVDLIANINRYNDLVAPNKKVKIFGICAGHQLLHHTAGGTVTRLDTPAHGVRPISSPFLEDAESLNVLAVNQFRVSTLGKGFVPVMSDSQGLDEHVVTMSKTATSIQYHPERTEKSFEAGQRAKNEPCPNALEPLDRAAIATILSRLIKSREVSTLGRIRSAVDGVSGSKTPSGSEASSLASSQSSENIAAGVFC